MCLCDCEAKPKQEAISHFEIAALLVELAMTKNTN